MTVQAVYKHTNLIARDWRRLSRFYQEVLGCIPVPPERDLSGKWLEDATGLPGTSIQGVHLRLPGLGDEGPTLEIFQYRPEARAVETAVNTPGLAHLAFAVDDVQAARDEVVASGGGVLGEIVTAEIPGAGRIHFTYVTDPEGNILELQRFSP